MTPGVSLLAVAVAELEELVGGVGVREDVELPPPALLRLLQVFFAPLTALPLVASCPLLPSPPLSPTLSMVAPPPPPINNDPGANRPRLRVASPTHALNLSPNPPPPPPPPLLLLLRPVGGFPPAEGVAEAAKEEEGVAPDLRRAWSAAIDAEPGRLLRTGREVGGRGMEMLRY